MKMKEKELVEYRTVNDLDSNPMGLVSKVDKESIGEIEEVVINPKAIFVGDNSANELIVASNGVLTVGYLRLNGEKVAGSTRSVVWELSPGEVDRILVECSPLPEISDQDIDETKKNVQLAIASNELDDQFDALDVKIFTNCFGKARVVIDGKTMDEPIAKLRCESSTSGNRVVMEVFKSHNK